MTRPLQSLLLAALALCSAFACATETISAESADDTSDTGDTETGGELPDLPNEPEPECPAALGDLVECECGHLGECGLSSADGSPCAVSCTAAQPCDVVLCEFDSAHDWPGCVSVVDPEALDCAFTALLSGEPVTVELRLDNTYGFSSYRRWRTITRLDGELVLSSTEFGESNDVGYSDQSWAAGVRQVSDAIIANCMVEDSTEAAFECLQRLEGSTCTALTPSCPR